MRASKISLAVFIALVSLIAVVALSQTGHAVTQATLTTDKSDYSPGDTVYITGTGWTPNAVVVVSVTRPDSSVQSCSSPSSPGFSSPCTSADSNGNFSAPPYVLDGIQGTYTISATDGSRSASITFTDATTDFTQCRNDLNHDLIAETCGWTSGDLVHTSSVYAEGQAVPQRLFQTISTAGTHTVDFTYDFTKSNIYAYDFITTVDLTQTGALLNQCVDLPSFVSLSACNSLWSGALNSTIPSDTFDSVASRETPVTRHVTIGGVSSATVTIIGHTPSTTCFQNCGTSSVDFRVTFTTASPNTLVGLWFAGHLAKGTGGWGTGFGAASISGSSFHISYAALDGSSIGNRDNQIQPGVVVFVIPTISTKVLNSSGTDITGTTVVAPVTVHDTATLSGATSDAGGTVTYEFFTTGDCSGTHVDQTVTVTNGIVPDSSSRTLNPSVTTSYSYQAVYSGDAKNGGAISACEPFTVTQHIAPPTVTKTATGTYTTTYKWTITKTVDNPTPFTAGGASVTVHYTVTVTPDSGTISNIMVSGTITVTNPNSLPMSVTVTDTLNDGTSCTVSGGGTATIAAGGTATFTYSCSDSNSSLPSSNNALVAWSSGVDSGTASSGPIAISPFTQTLVDNMVTVTDTLGGSLGTCNAVSNPSGCTFTYPITFTDPAGTCTNHQNNATFTTNTTSTTGSASASVTDCQGANLTVSKTATASFARSFSWTISKSVDQTSVFTAGGAPVTVNYLVSVTGTSTDSSWQVTGTITVHNPNNWESVALTGVTDVINNGGSCVVSGNTSQTIIASGDSSGLTYMCTYSSEPSPASGTNTATATWNGVAAHTTASSASGSAGVDFSTVTPSTTGSATVTVTDSLGGSLGTCSAPNPTGILSTNPSSATCNFPYPITFMDPAGTCTTHPNTATIKETGQSASASVTDCQGANLTVSKTATPSFTRTFHWGISKTANSTSPFTAGGASVAIQYAVSVTHDSGTDSAWAISGTITVTNPNDWESITFNLADNASLGSSCSITGGSGPYTIAASATLTYSYSCTFTSGASGTNTATATWDASTAHTPDATATGTAGFSFTTPTTIVDGTVVVTDSQAGTLGTVSYTDPSPTVFTYTKTFTDPAGTCTSHANTATFTTDTTGTTGSVSVTVTDCQGADLIVSKTVSPTFTRTFTWGISKTVDNNKIYTAGGTPGTVTYTVSITHDSGTDSAWAVTGTITVTNPNNWEAITLSGVSDSATGGVCTVAPGTMTVPASGSMTFTYSCTFSSGAGGMNTATAIWNGSTYHTPSGSASGSAPFAFTTPTTIIDGSVRVTDTQGGPLGTVSYTDPSPTTFTYSQTFTDPAGTCTSHANTATFTTNTTGTTGSASQTVTDCQGADLTVSKTATPTFTRTFTWGISKSADQTSVFTAGGAPATVNYVVSVTHDSGTDSAWATTGTITVTNPNDWESITFNLADSAGLGSSCSITGGSGPYSVPASGSLSFTYSCTFTSGASGTNTAIATWDSSAFHTPSGSASGSAPFAFTTPTMIVDGSVTVTDTQAGTLGTVSYTDPSPTVFTYSKTFTDSAGTCTSHPNTAGFTTNTTGTTGSSSVTVTDCQGADLTVSKTATPTFTRTFHWNIGKSVDNAFPFTAGGSSVTSTYTVSVTHDSGTDSAWAISGTITVHNPNDWEAITFSLSDTGCSISGGTGPFSIAAGATLSFTYSCTFGSGASGTNTATATWDSSAFHTPDASASGSAPFAFTTPTTIVDGSVIVTDSNPAGPQGVAVSYTDPSPTTFTYTVTYTDPTGTCTSHANTVTFTTSTTFTTGSASVTVKDCQGADLTVSKTATPTFTRTFAWSISKSVDKTLVYLSQGGTATFTYTVSVTHDSGTDSLWQVTGTITVHNPNNWESVTLNGVSDAVNNGGVCIVSGNTAQTIAPLGNSVGLTYMCNYTSQPAYNTAATNTATATWDGSVAHTTNSSATGTASFSFTSPTTIVDGSVTVTDTLFGGTLGTASATGAACTHSVGVTCTDVAGGTNFVYQHTITPPSGTCVTANNTAIFTTNTTGKTGSASQSVQACVVVATITTKVSPSMLSMPGMSAKDNATVSLSPSGQTVSGTVTFKVYGPFNSPPTSGSCTGTFTTLGPVVIGPGVSPQFALSPTFTPSGMGYYAFVATYTPSAVANGNTVSTTCGDSGETLLVAPMSQVTDTSFCAIPQNQFPLNLITDPQNPGSFELVSTNPGQFYDNVFYFAAPGSSVGLTIGIPFPFVSQGSVPIQVSSNFGITNGCFSPNFDSTSQFTITASGGTLSSSGNPIIILSDYTTQQLGSYVYITVTGTVPSSGLVYVTVHMNYGLRGQDFNKITTGASSGSPAVSCTTNPCAQWTANTNVTLGSPQPYVFTVGGSLTTSYTVTSINNFKKDPGFAGVVTDANGKAIAGATVKIYDNNGNLLGITTTDNNGIYLFAYKYTGSATTFTLKVILPTGATQNQTVTMKSNKLVLADFGF